MVVVVQPDQRGSAATAPMRTGRTAWLILAADGPATEVPARVPSTAVRVIADPRRFRDVLLAERPRIVVCAQPPADAEALRLVADERRRRTGDARDPPRPAGRRRRPPRGARHGLRRRAGLDHGRGRSWPGASSGSRRRPGRARAPRSCCTFGDGLELDLAAHELRREGEAVHLRPKEFGLLALLAAHPGRAYTRRELLHLVWGATHVGGERTVDVHVRWLRSKIEPLPGRADPPGDRPRRRLPARRGASVNRPLTRRTRAVDAGDPTVGPRQGLEATDRRAPAPSAIGGVDPSDDRIDRSASEASRSPRRCSSARAASGSGATAKPSDAAPSAAEPTKAAESMAAETPAESTAGGAVDRHDQRLRLVHRRAHLDRRRRGVQGGQPGLRLHGRGPGHGRRLQALLRRRDRHLRRLAQDQGRGGRGLRRRPASSTSSSRSRSTACPS